jgi:hypothetical protein
MLYHQAAAMANLDTFRQVTANPYMIRQATSTQISEAAITAQRGFSSKQFVNNEPSILTSHQPTKLERVTSSSSLNATAKAVELLATSSMFQRRTDWSILKKLPVSKQNTIHIRVEDEGPYGNDEIRCFILSHFGSMHVKAINCAFCNTRCVVYDRFPLIDGTLFISPFMYGTGKSVPSVDGAAGGSQPGFISAVCLKCILCAKGHEIKCIKCEKSWQELGGHSFQIGTLYKFDLFASLPCCQQRLKCVNCKCDLVSLRDAQESCSFSRFSQEAMCGNCGLVAQHFVRNLAKVYLNAK